MNTITNTTVNYMQVLPSSYSTKDYVACKPMVAKVQEKASSIASLMTKTENLEPLEVILGTEDNAYHYGDKIYLRAESYENPGLKKIYHIDGIAFILVERHLIIASTAIPRIKVEPAPQYIPVPIYPQPQQQGWPHPGYPVPNNPSITIWWTVTGSSDPK